MFFGRRRKKKGRGHWWVGVWEEGEGGREGVGVKLNK